MAEMTNTIGSTSQLENSNQPQPEQLAFVAALRKVFGNKPFDRVLIMGETHNHSELVLAIEAALPGRKWWRKDGFEHNRHSYNALGRLLQNLQKNGYLVLANDRGSWLQV